MRIVSYPRLHIALADLAGSTPRRYGGAGIAIQGLPTVIDVDKSRRSELILPSTVDDTTTLNMRALLERLRMVGGGLYVNVRTVPQQHIGLGSKTALAMAIAAGGFRAFKLKANRTELQRLSGRGGASGVGVHTFFDGGFVTDAGHAQRSDASYRPSSATTGHTPPPRLVWLPVPRSWRLTLMLPEGTRYSGKEEKRFFQQHTPIASISAFRTLALLYHGVAAAIATSDIALLSQSLAAIHRTGFKRREVLGQPRSVGQLLRAFHARSTAVGMSSMGPLVYAVSPDGPHARAVERFAQDLNVPVLGTFVARNKGHEFIDE